MCRSQAQGGRRCSGSSRSRGSTAASGGDARPSRRFDGKPETEADKRFFDLRESGYTGPIDQDGRIPAADDPVHDIMAAMQRASA